MKYTLLIALSVVVQCSVFAQSGSTDAESDSLFKVFLQKSKGVKFEQPYKKDTIVGVKLPKDTIMPPTRPATAASTKQENVAPISAKPVSSKENVREHKAEASPLKSNAVVNDSISSKKQPTVTVSTPTSNKPVEKAETPKVAKIAGLHKFKEAGTGYALEAERKGTVVKLYLRMEDIEQYAEVILVRGSAEVGNFTDVRHIEIIKGANKYEYVETEDRYPLSTKVASAYKVRAVTKDGAIRTFPAITLEPGIK